MSTDLPPYLGPHVPMTYRCTRETVGGLCDQSAMTHLAMTTDAENIYACDEHLQEAMGFGALDLHPIAADCANRPATWVWSTELEVGRCVAEFNPDLFALESEAMEVGR